MALNMQYPKWKGFVLPSYELNHIYKDPPKSYFTRRSEKVSESDITNMLWSSDRFAENINWVPRGVDPVAGISYSNGAGLKSNLSHQNQGHNPYKVAKDGAFRPPMYRQEDLVPLSRLPRLPFSMQTNLGSSYSNTMYNELIDKDLVNRSITVPLQGQFETNITKESMAMIDDPNLVLHPPKLSSEVQSNINQVGLLVNGMGGPTENDLTLSHKVSGQLDHAPMNIGGITQLEDSNISLDPVQTIQYQTQQQPWYETPWHTNQENEIELRSKLQTSMQTQQQPWYQPNSDRTEIKLDEIQNIYYDLPVQASQGVRQLDDSGLMTQRMNDVNVIDYDVVKQLPKFTNIDNSDTTQGIDQDVRIVSVAPNLDGGVKKSFDWVEKELDKIKLRPQDSLYDFGTSCGANRMSFDHMKHNPSKLSGASHIYQDRYQMFKL